ncbi:hypothetical protein LINPERPRIM_LOCUS23320 [Linum perenne]
MVWEVLVRQLSPKLSITSFVHNLVDFALWKTYEKFCRKDGIVTLQSKIISSIFRADYYVKNANEGLHVIKDRVCKHKDLVVLLANGAFRS